MRNRTFLLLVATVLFLGIGVSSAFAWANGADTDGDGLGDNGYGTHDWLVHQAIRLAGSQASWLDEDIATLASDDPDTVLKDTYNHLYQDTVKGQGGPQAVADTYFRMQTAYQAGDYAKASREFGLLSHYYSDICQPYHTIWNAADEPEHLPYEFTVDDYHRSPTANESWITPAARVPVTDIRARAVAAALAARSDYSALRTAFVPGSHPDSHGNFSASASSVTGAITRRRLSRAANDLSDILLAVPTGHGAATEVTVTSLTTFRRYVGRTSNVAAYAKVTDSAGRPVRGVRVTYAWQFSTGTKKAVAYTDSSGLATLYQNMGNEKLWYKVVVTATTSANGVVSARSNWVMPTPVIGYIKTTMSNTRPAQRTTVRATTKILDSAGKPIQGLRVVFSWKFKSGTVTAVTYTNRYGIAYSSRNIGGAAKGYRVYVRAQTQSANYNRSSTASFIPR